MYRIYIGIRDTTNDNVLIEEPIAAFEEALHASGCYGHLEREADEWRPETLQEIESDTPGGFQKGAANDAEIKVRYPVMIENPEECSAQCLWASGPFCAAHCPNVINVEE